MHTLRLAVKPRPQPRDSVTFVAVVPVTAADAAPWQPRPRSAIDEIERSSREADRTDLGQAISKHLKVLERAGLITRGRDAQRRPCRIEGKPLADVSGWLESYRQIWEANFQRLDALLEELQSPEKKAGPRKGKRP